MKKSISLTLLFVFMASLFSSAAIAPANHPETTISGLATTESTFTKKELRKERRFKKLVDKLQKKIQQKQVNMKKKAASWSASQYLVFCLAFLLGSIIFFALGIGILGSLGAIGAAVFLVLWILAYTGNI